MHGLVMFLSNKYFVCMYLSYKCFVPNKYLMYLSYCQPFVMNTAVCWFSIIGLIYKSFPILVVLGSI